MASGTATLSEELREPPDRGLLEREKKNNPDNDVTVSAWPIANCDHSNAVVRARIKQGLGFDLSYSKLGQKVQQPLPGLMYAEDIVLMANNRTELQELMSICGREGEELGLEFKCIPAQVLVGVLLIFNGRYNINKTHQQRRAETLNNLVIIGVFLITVINIFVSAFSGPDTPRWVSEKSRIP
ncbi:unnamed protein product [Ixodes pacificus]